MQITQATPGSSEKVNTVLVRQQEVMPARRVQQYRSSSTAEAMLRLQRTHGNCFVQKAVQAKLEVSQPGDPHEQEADQVAERIISMPSEAAQMASQSATISDEEKDKKKSPQPIPVQEEEKRHSQTIAASRSAEDEMQNDVLPHAEEAVSAALSSTGQPLPPHLYRKFEQGLGVDLSAVRVHTGDHSVAANKAISARAFTVGNDIHFNKGQYDPESPDGQRLAHEVTHTVQQQGVTSTIRKKPEVLEHDSASKIRSDRPSDAALLGYSKTVSRIPAKVSISRKKEAPSPFAGAAGTADVRAKEAGSEAGGVSPINVSTEYATQQAERKEKQMDDFRKADIPFVYDNQEHYAYKKLIDLRQEYINDVSRIALAQGAFNDFVIPGTLANKSFVQFKKVQFELGYFGDVNPTEELSAKERKILATKLDEKTMNDLNKDIQDKEKIASGKRTVILGLSHNIQAAMAKRAGVLAVEAKTKAEKEKTEIDEKIKAVKEGVETVGKVIEAVSFAGISGPAAIKEIAEGGSGAIKGGLEVGGKSTGLIGSTAEFIMTQVYKDQIQKAKQEIEKAKVAEESARKMDAELSYTGSMLQVSGELDQLEGATGQLAAALKARKEYFAKLGSETDTATGGKPGGKISQYLTYVSQANETKSYIESAKASAVTGSGVMTTQINAMKAHRNYAYVADSAGVWDDRARKVDGNGPDLEQLDGARDTLDSFLKSADKELVIINNVIGSLPSPQ